MSARNTPDIVDSDDAMVLTGFTIGITADRRWEEQAGHFERRGATVQHGASIRTLPLGCDQRLRTATEQVIAQPPAALIANTGVGIRSWFSAAETWSLADALTAALRDTRIYARGPKAASAIQLHGLEVFARAKSERLTEAVDLARRDLRPGDAVVLQLDGSGPSEQTSRLRTAGASVVEVPVYVWTKPDDDGPAVRLAENVIAGKVHAVTFTAGPAIRNWMAMAAERDLDSDLRRALTNGQTVVGCVGPVCVDAAADEGIATSDIVVPKTWRLGSLVRAVTDRLLERRLALDVGGARLVIAGNLVTVGDSSVLLTDSEAQVLTVLAEQPNLVVAKTDLLRMVWRDETADPHVVEAAVNRLRRRLTPLGVSITSVYRRGYSLKL